MSEITPPHIMIVEAHFYADVSEALADGAMSAIDSVGATYERFEVPGALEIPGAIRIALQAMEEVRDGPHFDGFVALGCVIRGETSHYDYVCCESARGLMDLSLQHGLAIGNGILTTENKEQALARARVDGKNKGGWAANSCLAMIGLKTKLGLMMK